MYRTTLDRIISSDEASTELAKKILMWLCYAQRPLRESELQHTIATEFDDDDFDPDGITPGELLQDSCVGIVACDERGMYSLFHLTAFEFFRSSPEFRAAAAHSLIAKTYIAYLSFASIGSQGACSDLESLELRKQDFSLLDYAAKHWGDHARQPEEELLEVIVTFITHDEMRRALMQAFYHRHREDEELRRVSFETLPSGSSPLQVVCGRGLVLTAERLLQDGADPAEPDDQGWTPLITASSYCHMDAVKLLLSQTCAADSICADAVNIDQDDENGWTPLFWATLKGHYAIAEHVLAAGASVRHQDGAGWTPMDWAAFRAEAPLVELFLRHVPRHPASNDDESLERRHSDQTPDSVPIIYSAKAFSSIFLAAESGDRASAEALLHSLDDPQLASRYDEELKTASKSIITLLEKSDRFQFRRTGQFPDATPSIIMTEKLSIKLLEPAIICSQLTLVKILVELGSPLGAIEGETRGRSPLHIAASHGQWKICNYLLSKGADASLQDTMEKSPLDLAVSAKSVRCIQGVYLASPPRSRASTKDLMTGFIRASSARLQHITIRRIRTKIDLGNKESARPRLPLESLHILDAQRSACCEQHISCSAESSPTSQETESDEVISFLRIVHDGGYDINRAGLNKANTPLHDACWAVTPDVVEFLLANAAEVNTRNEFDESPLHIVCARLTPTSEAPNKQKGILLALLELLVRFGADVNALNRSGDSPLHILCRQQPPNELLDAIRFLLANGANVDCYNRNNKHLVHALCRRSSHSSSGDSNHVDTIKFV